jgi:hypothetical protein
MAVRSHSALRAPRSAFGGLAQLLLIGWLVLGGATVHAQTPTGTGQVQIQITRPTSGERIPSAEVLVTLVTTGDIAVAPPTASEWPGPGEFHVLLDGVDVLQTTRLQFSLTPVTPGAHTLRVELHDWPGGTATPAEVAVTVAPTPPPTGTSWWLAGTVAGVAVILLVSLSLLWLRWVRPVQANPVYDEADAPSAAPDDESLAG